MLAGLAPASAFELNVDGTNVPRSVSLGWAATFRTPEGVATLVLHQLPLNAVLAGITLGLWLVMLLGFGTLERIEGPIRRRRPVVPAGPAGDGDEVTIASAVTVSSGWAEQP